MPTQFNEKCITLYPDVDVFLLEIATGIENILDKDLVGLYLFGSLTYGDFNPDSSDIDLVAIINKPINKQELAKIKKLHQQLAEHDPK